MNTQQKTILITGASSGIGEACATLLASKGARLILTARRLDRLQALAKTLQQNYQTSIYYFQCDVTDAHAVTEALSHIPNDFLPIDVLVNNAGLALGLDKVHEGLLDDWERMIDTNIKGILYFTRALLPHMVQRNVGHIITLGSTAGHQTYPGGSVYCATKTAVHSLMKTLNQEIAGTAIRATEIAPGMVETEFSQVRFKGDEARAKKVYENLTALTPADVADAIEYAISRPAHMNIAQMILYSTSQPAANRPG